MVKVDGIDGSGSDEFETVCRVLDDENLSFMQKVGVQHLVGLRRITFTSTLGPPQPKVMVVMVVMVVKRISIRHLILS